MEQVARRGFARNPICTFKVRCITQLTAPSSSGTGAPGGGVAR